MPKRICALALALSILFCCGGYAFAADPADGDGHAVVGYSDEEVSSDATDNTGFIVGYSTGIPKDSLKSLILTQQPSYPNWSLLVQLVDVENDHYSITPYYSFDNKNFTSTEPIRIAYSEEFLLEADVEPMLSFAEGRSDELWLYVAIESYDGSYSGRSKTYHLTRNAAKPQIPIEEIANINVGVEQSQTGWRLKVTVPDSIKNSARTISYEYSFDGKTFLPVTLESDDRIADCYIPAAIEPTKSFANKAKDSFYFRILIEGENYNGYSNTFEIKRETTPQLPPEGTQLLASLPQSSQMSMGRPPVRFGLFNVTVREGDTAQTLASYLPTELPVRVQLQFRDETTLREHFEVQDMFYPVSWTLPEGTLKDGRINNCLEFVPPTDEFTFTGVLNNYLIPQLPRVQTLALNPDNSGGLIYLDMPAHLAVNMIAADEKLAPQLGLDTWQGTDQEVLSFSLPYKPSGAVSIVPQYSVDGGSSWQTVERKGGNDLVKLGYAPNRVPKQASYAAPLFFDNEQSPMREYLADSSNGFLVRLKIDGGVYDGVSEAFAWPGDYDYSPPPYIDTDLDGGGGNRGDAGTGNGGTGGERPGIPSDNDDDDDDDDEVIIFDEHTTPEDLAPPTTTGEPAELTPVDPQGGVPVIALPPPTGEAVAVEESANKSPSKREAIIEPAIAPPEDIASPVRESRKSVKTTGAAVAVAILAVAVVFASVVIAIGPDTAATLSGRVAAVGRKLFKIFIRRS